MPTIWQGHKHLPGHPELGYTKVCHEGLAMYEGSTGDFQGSYYSWCSICAMPHKPEHDDDGLWCRVSSSAVVAWVTCGLL